MTSRIHRYAVWRWSACPCAVSDRDPAQTLIRNCRKCVGEVDFQMKMGMGALLVGMAVRWRTPGSPCVSEKRTGKTPMSVLSDIPADMSHLCLDEREQVESCALLLKAAIEWVTQLSLVDTQWGDVAG